MKHAFSLPERYCEIADIDLQKNKKLMLLVNGLALVIAAAMTIPVLFWVPISTFLGDMSDFQNLLYILLKLAVGMIALVLYIILHELVHGICMRAITGKKPKYGFTGLYAYAGSDAYFGKAAYLLIALAPVVLWGVVLALLVFIVPKDWFWIVYFIQIQNISGAAGDMYVTCRMLRMPKDILVQDSGVAMKVYSQKQ